MYSDLIYDFGVNDGRDTEFYLLKGYRVMGIEANPLLYENLKNKFSSQIATGQLILLNIGVWSECSSLTFYINENSHWSSFEPAYGCRNGTRFETVIIDCLTAKEIIRRHGMPYYMKIDVEGADKHILADLKTIAERPAVISVEEYGVECIDALRELGYSKFKIVGQWHKSTINAPFPPKEGLYVPRTFQITDTGLFGQELPDDWMSYKEIREYFTKHIRNEQFEYLGPDYKWYDVHAIL